MIIFKNPVLEELSKAIYSEGDEERLKIVKFERGSNSLAIYCKDEEIIKRQREELEQMERDIKKARKVMAFYTLAYNMDAQVIETDEGE